MMVTLECEITLTVKHPADNREAVREEVDRVMQELLVLEASGCGISNSALSLDLENSTVIAELVSTGATFEEAQEIADSSLRAAIHAAGGGTRDWFSITRKQLDRETV